MRTTKFYAGKKMLSIFSALKSYTISMIPNSANKYMFNLAVRRHKWIKVAPSQQQKH